MELFFPGRRSSGVEQLIRNQQAAGSNPIAGSMTQNCYKNYCKKFKPCGASGGMNSLEAD